MVIFSTIGLFVRYINLESPLIALSRAALGSLCLILFLKFRGQEFNFKAVLNNLKFLILAGGALGLNWIFLFEAYKLTTIANATLAYYMAPLILIILCALFLKEQVTYVKLGCIVLAMLGMSLVAGIFESGNTLGLKGILMGLIAALFYASLVLCNKFFKDLPSFEATISQLFIAACVILPYVIVSTNFSTLKVTTLDLGLLLVIGICHTALAYVLFYAAIPKLEATRIAICSYLDPAFAILWSVLLLGESLTFTGILGALLILGAALGSELFGKKKA